MSSDSNQGATRPDQYAYSGDADKSMRPSDSHCNRDAVRDQAICAWRPDTSDSEKAKAWREANRATLDKPLQLNKDGTYTVTGVDCLDSIAERELKMMGKAVNKDAIEAEVKNLVQLNDKRHPTLDCNSQFVGNGWKLHLSISGRQTGNPGTADNCPDQGSIAQNPTGGPPWAPGRDNYGFNGQPVPGTDNGGYFGPDQSYLPWQQGYSPNYFGNDYSWGSQPNWSPGILPIPFGTGYGWNHPHRRGGEYQNYAQAMRQSSNGQMYETGMPNSGLQYGQTNGSQYGHVRSSNQYTGQNSGRTTAENSGTTYTQTPNYNPGTITTRPVVHNPGTITNPVHNPGTVIARQEPVTGRPIQYQPPQPRQAYTVTQTNPHRVQVAEQQTTTHKTT